jgi:hypothetical protein
MKQAKTAAELPPHVWKVQDCADFSGMSHQTYRSKVMSLASHPKPILNTSAYSPIEIQSFFADPNNLR